MSHNNNSSTAAAVPALPPFPQSVVLLGSSDEGKLSSYNFITGNNNNNSPTNFASSNNSSFNELVANSSDNDGSMSTSGGDNNFIQLCASCDRCRARKTKCDGRRPCGNCKIKYLRVNKLIGSSSGADTFDETGGGWESNFNLDDVDIAEFDCIYSPAKRRGPVPGKSTQSRRQQKLSSNSNNDGGVGSINQQQLQLQLQLQQQQLLPPAANSNFSHNLNISPTLTSPIGTNHHQQLLLHHQGSDDFFMNQGFDNLNINAGIGGGGGGVDGGGFQQQSHHGNSINMNSNINTMNLNSSTTTSNNSIIGGVDFNSLLNQLNQQQQLNEGNNNISNSNNILATDQMKNMLLLQQQLMLQQQQIQQQQLAQQLAQLGGIGRMRGGELGGGGGLGGIALAPVALGVGSLSSAMDNSSFQILQQYQNNATQQQLQPRHFQQQTSLQQLQQADLNQIQQMQQHQQVNLNPSSVLSGQQQLGDIANHYQQLQQQEDDMIRSAKRVANDSSNNKTPLSIVATHLPLLEPNNQCGSLLLQYFELSTNNIFNLPPIPTNDQHCAILNESGMSCLPSNLPLYDQSALNAARFSQLALGALSDDQLGLALELSNACVMCLKNCTEEPTHKSCMSAVARAYLLHGIFRSLRGDMVRYFKYRRVCMTRIYMLDEHDENVDALLAAISFHDAWAYMMYNAIEDELPDIDDVFPPISTSTDNTARSFGCCEVVTDPINRMWMQGQPRIFLKNEARIVDRSLDAISCAVRSCCDQANQKFDEMTGLSSEATPTSLAVMANENEFCSRNMVMSAQALINQAKAGEKVSKPGLTMMLTAMDAFLENSDQDSASDGGEEGGFTETQILNLLSACEIAIKHPMLLHAPGPVYHMMSNATVLLCHLLNGLHAKCSMGDSSGDGSSNVAGRKNDMETEMFYETLETFMSMRKLLSMHRQNLPVRLRCHAIPHPNVGPSKKTDPDAPFIDLSETLMCSCRGCQGFVLMGCAPCVAAERCMRSAKIHAKESEGDDESKREFQDFGEFNLDDDALISSLSQASRS